MRVKERYKARASQPTTPVVGAREHYNKKTRAPLRRARHTASKKSRRQEEKQRPKSAHERAREREREEGA